MSLDIMKQALEALEAALSDDQPYIERCKQTITALRTAIEQAQGKHEDWCASLTQLLLSMPPKPAPCNCKSKTASPRQWQGLTDQEIWSDGSTMDLSEDGIRNFARAIEAKLREKNT